MRLGTSKLRDCLRGLALGVGLAGAVCAEEPGRLPEGVAGAVRPAPRLFRLPPVETGAPAAPGVVPASFTTPGRAPTVSPVAVRNARSTMLPETRLGPELPTVVPARPLNLRLDDVLSSVDAQFPLLLAAMQERGIAAGQWTAALGAFDLKLNSTFDSTPMGYYQHYQTRVKLEQATYWGGKVYSGYKLGRGFFPIWFGDDTTNDGGEFHLGMQVSLWQDRPIDKRRLEIRKGEIARQLAEPTIQRQRIDFLSSAAVVFWDWVAARQSLDVAEQLLELALVRDQVLSRRVERGDLARMAQIENQSLIIQRKLKRTAAEQKFLQAGIKLSLFWRDADGAPVLPSSELAPRRFPATPPPAERLAMAIERARGVRPELRALRLERQKTGAELAYAQNLLSPTLDAGLKAAQDVGHPYSNKQDKSPFQLEAGVYFDVPVQRRNAQGQVRGSQAKLAQLAAKTRFTAEKIEAEVRVASVALENAWRQIDQAVEGVRLAEQVEALERRKFDLGASNLLFLNLREVATADARQRLLDVRQAYFVALVEYRAALGWDVPGPDWLAGPPRPPAEEVTPPPPIPAPPAPLPAPPELPRELPQPLSDEPPAELNAPAGDE